jgi:Arc/MetJ-type ribon-helix-helix transcriptional regulator
MAGKMIIKERKTFRLPKQQLEFIDKLVIVEDSSLKSEAIRAVIRGLINAHYEKQSTG